MIERVFVSSSGYTHSKRQQPRVGDVLVWDNLTNTWIWIGTDKLKYHK